MTYAENWPYAARCRSLRARSTTPARLGRAARFREVLDRPHPEAVAGVDPTDAKQFQLNHQARPRSLRHIGEAGLELIADRRFEWDSRLQHRIHPLQGLAYLRLQTTAIARSSRRDDVADQSEDGLFFFGHSH